MYSLELVHNFLKKATSGESKITPEVVSLFSKECHESLAKQFSRDTSWKIRPSSLGKPLCQQLMERDGNTEILSYSSFMRFVFGDMIEAITMAVLRASKVKVVDYHKHCEIYLGGETIRGTLDVVIDDPVEGVKIWDIKSASPFSYEQKFARGYDYLKDNDPFGYVMQGYLYSEMTGIPFGGWIVVNKSSGEIQAINVPEECSKDQKEYIAMAENRIKILRSKSKFKRDFEDVPEFYKKKPTGNRVLSFTCSFCGHKETCWKNVRYHPKITSHAKFPPKVWYTKLAVSEIL